MTDLEKELIAFYWRLVRSQQALPEFAARVLHENLWALYD